MLADTLMEALKENHHSRVREGKRGLGGGKMEVGKMEEGQADYREEGSKRKTESEEVKKIREEEIPRIG